MGTGGIRENGRPLSFYASVVILAVTLILSFLIPLAVSSVLVLVDRRMAHQIAGRPRYMRTYKLPAGVCQDQFHVSLLVVFAVWLPMLALAHFHGSLPERWAAVGTLIASFHLLLGKAFFWVLDNNVGHINRQREHLSLEPETRPSSRWEVLRQPTRAARWLVRQNRTPERQASGEEDYIAALESHIHLQNALALSLLVSTAIGLLVYVNDAPPLDLQT
jgi:hypothetical protein